MSCCSPGSLSAVMATVGQGLVVQLRQTRQILPAVLAGTTQSKHGIAETLLDDRVPVGDQLGHCRARRAVPSLAARVERCRLTRAQRPTDESQRAEAGERQLPPATCSVMNRPAAGIRG